MEEMGSSLNYCTGFFGSDAPTFNRTMLLCWMMSTNQLADFYSDQPMVNIMCSFFSLPTKDVGRDATLHLGDISQERIRFEEGKLIFEDIAPSVIHFNGRKGQFYQNVIDKIRDQSGSTYYVDSYLKRNIFIPAKRKVRYIKKSWMMKYIRKLYNAITGAI